MSAAVIPDPAVRYERPLERAPIKVLNALGRALGRFGVVPVGLSEQSLLRAARRRTGLCDFGEDSFREPLGVLVRALETEARLHTFGRIHARGFLANSLSNRLLLEHWWTRHPEMLAGEIRGPVFVLGLPRTGTTLLQKLLASDPANRSLTFWEAHEPCPPPSRETCANDPRRKRAARHIRVLDYLSPDFLSIHEFESEGPEECYPLLANTMVGAQFSWMFDVPTYDAWLAASDKRLSYEYYRRQLLLLQWRWPAQRWVLKSPVHLFAVDAILATFPDARIIQLHRDPVKVVASICSLVATMRALASDRIDSAGIGENMTRSLTDALERCMIVRRSVDVSRVCDVQYVDLLRDPLATVRDIYERFDLTLGPGAEAQVARRLVESPQHKRGVHRYSLERWGLTAQGVRSRFARYCDAFGIREEV